MPPSVEVANAGHGTRDERARCWIPLSRGLFIHLFIHSFIYFFVNVNFTSPAAGPRIPRARARARAIIITTTGKRNRNYARNYPQSVVLKSHAGA